MILDKCELREALVSTLAVLDQVIDLSLVSSTVTGLSQTVRTPMTSNTPRSTDCPSPKSSSDLSTGQSNLSSQIESSKNNNSTNEDALDEDTASTTAESIVVVLPTPPVIAPQAPEAPSQPEPVNIVSERDEILSKPVSEPVTPSVIDETISIVSSEGTTVDASEVHYTKKASEAWAKLKEKFPEQTNWPVKIQHLDLGSPEVYVTAIIDITEHKDMSDEFAKALIAVPHSKAKPLESDILGNDWLVKRPETISSKNEFVRFRPTHIKDNMVKGL